MQPLLDRDDSYLDIPGQRSSFFHTKLINEHRWLADRTPADTASLARASVTRARACRRMQPKACRTQFATTECRQRTGPGTPPSGAPLIERDSARSTTWSSHPD